MRILLPALVAGSLVLTGCFEPRDNVTVLPDRGGHAKTSQPAQGAPTRGPVPYDTEQIYTVVQGDTLTSVAKRFGVTTEKLIKRNQIDDLAEFKAGKNIIVPKTPSAWN